MASLSAQEKTEKRKQIYKLIDELLALEAMGWDMTEHLKSCGDALCSDNKPNYRPTGLSDRDYYFYLGVARQNGIPIRVYKDRLRRGKSVEQAATAPYESRGEHPEKPFIAIARKQGISHNTYISRRTRGWSKQQAAYTPLMRVKEHCLQRD